MASARPAAWSGGLPFAPRARGTGARPLVQLGAVVAASAAAGAFVVRTGGPLLPVGVLVMIAAAWAGVVRPAGFLLAFLLIRPLLDQFGSYEFGPGLDPSGLSALLLVAILLVVLTATRGRSLPPASGPLTLVIAVNAFAAGYAVYSLRGAIGTEPVGELARLVALLGVFLLAALGFCDAGRRRQLWRVVALSAVVPAGYAMVQWIGGVQDAQGLEVGRIDSTFVGPNPFGAYLAVCALLLISAPLRLRLRVRGPVLLLVLAALVSTYSREGWFLFLGGLVVLEWRRRPALLSGLLAALVVLVLTVPSVHDRIAPPDLPVGQNTTATYESFSWRIDTWAALMRKYQESPVIGFGLRSTAYVNPRRSPELDNVAGGYAAHNMVVRWLVEGGVVLLIAFALLLAALIRDASRARRGPADVRPYGHVMLVLWGGFVVVGISTDDPTSNTALMYALLALAGSLAGRPRLPSKHAARPRVHGCAPAPLS